MSDIASAVSRLKSNHDILDFVVCSVVEEGFNHSMGIVKSQKNDVILLCLMIDSILDELMHICDATSAVVDVKMSNNDIMVIMGCLCEFQTVSTPFKSTVGVLDSHRETYKHSIEALYSILQP
jgi:hypothetical protein